MEVQVELTGVLMGGQVYFTASKNWTGKTSSNGSHSHTITSTLNKSPIYGNNETVQPPSVGLKVKTRFK